MIKKGRFLPLLLAFLLLFTSCQAGNSNSTEESSVAESSQSLEEEEEKNLSGEEEDPRMAEYERRRQEIFAAHVNYLGGLSKEQMREDLDYFWDTVHTGYPFLGVVARAGIDPEEVYQESLRRLEEEVDNDFDFINLIQWVAMTFEGRGHINAFMGASLYDYYLETYGAIADQRPHWQYLYNFLQNPVMAGSYEKMRPIEDDLTAAYEEIFGGDDDEEEEDELPEPEEDMEIPPDLLPHSTGNVTTDILLDGTVAYLKIPSFSGMLVEDDQAEIYDFYQSVQDLPHLIIDITGNGGGSDAYWNQNIVNMLLRETVTDRQYILGNTEAPYNQGYIQASMEDVELYPIDELPEFPAFQKDDLQYLNAFTYHDYTYDPPESSLRYPGQIWVLVDGQVYSASESFSMFCKSTGFATLVGETTGGDGGGSDPNIFMLPNSGLAYRFSVFYTINPDGSNSEEAGTAPDIFTAPGKTALETCLDEIAALQAAA